MYISQTWYGEPKRNFYVRDKEDTLTLLQGNALHVTYNQWRREWGVREERTQGWTLSKGGDTITGGDTLTRRGAVTPKCKI